MDEVTMSVNNPPKEKGEIDLRVCQEGLPTGSFEVPLVASDLPKGKVVVPKGASGVPPKGVRFGRNKPTDKPSGQSPSKGKAEKSLKSADGVCKFFDAGSCKKGDQCNFQHAKAGPSERREPAENPVVSTAGPAIGGRIKVTLDVALVKADFDTLVSMFPQCSIINGQGKELHVHAIDRAVRAVVCAVGLSLIGKKRVLCLQGKDCDFYQRAPVDCCRRPYFADDLGDDSELCDNRVGNSCVHENKLAAGEYDVIYLLDVPASPDDLARLRASYPTVKEIFSALHVYSVMEGAFFGQEVVWTPCEAGENVPGSVGKYVVTCWGTTVLHEPDHYWITTQNPMCGLKPEIVARFEKPSYTIVRFPPGKVKSVPTANINVKTFLKMRVAIVPTRVGGLMAYKFSRDFAVFEYQGMTLPSNCRELISELNQISGCDTSDAIRAKLAARYRRDEFEMEQEPLAALVCEFKRVQEKPYLEAEYKPLEKSRCCFNWMSANRRAVDQEHSRMRGGDYEAGKPWGFWALLISLMSAVCSVLPMPVVWWEFVQERVAMPWFSWCESTLNLGVVNVTSWIPSLNMFHAQYQHHVLRWTISYSLWHVPFRMVFWVATFLLLLSSARGAPVTLCPVSQMYASDRFSPIDWEGALPLNSTHCFGLPGTVTERKLSQPAEGCGIEVAEELVFVRPDAHKLYAIGGVFGFAIPVVYSTCQANMVAAVNNRQLGEVPLPEDWAAFDRLAAEFFEHLKRTSFERPRNVSFGEWNARFPPARAADHLVAKADLESGVPPSWEKICERKSFSKVEKLLIREDKDPRCISGASDWWNVIFGPWFMALPELLKGAYNYTSDVFYATSTTSCELGSWFDRVHESGGRAMCGDDQLSVLRDPVLGVVYAEGDGSRHDSHMHEGFWKLKWNVYVWLCGGWQCIPKSINEVVKLGQQLTKGACKAFAIKYWHPYRVRSGDCDTSGGNTVCTDFVAWFIEKEFHRMRKAGFSLSQVAVHVEQACRVQLGYTLKLKLTQDPTEVTLLSGIFVPVGGQTFWSPLPGRLMARLGWTLHLPSAKARWMELAGTINSFKAFRFVPFLRVYLEVIMCLVPERYRLTPPKVLYHGVRDLDNVLMRTGAWCPRDPSEDTWHYFLARYGLTKEDEATFRVTLQSAKSLPFMFRSSV